MTDRADMSGHFTPFVRRRKRLEGRTDTDMCLRTCPLSAPDRGTDQTSQMRLQPEPAPSPRRDLFAALIWPVPFQTRGVR